MMPVKDEGGQASSRTEQENQDLARLRDLMLAGGSLENPTWNYHLLTYLRRQTLAKVLWWNHIYEQIIDLPGSIMEFGVHYGTSMTTLMSFRAFFEPYNYQRMIVGFDTFEGFASVSLDDTAHLGWEVGDYATPEGFASHLAEVLAIQERMSPLSHMKRHELVVGDASKTLPDWLEAHPEELIALAILDMDVYEATRDVLHEIQPRLFKGSIVVLDELCSRAFPGETRAFLEVIGSRTTRLRRFPLQPMAAYFVVE